MRRTWSLIIALLVLGTTCASAAQVTTIVGTWRWANGGPAVFAPDGTARRQGQTGEWERRGDSFVVTWFDAQPGMQNEIESIDTLALSGDGKSLSGRAGDGSTVRAALISRAHVAVAAPAANRAAVAYAPAPVLRPQSANPSSQAVAGYSNDYDSAAAAAALGQANPNAQGVPATSSDPAASASAAANAAPAAAAPSAAAPPRAATSQAAAAARPPQQQVYQPPPSPRQTPSSVAPRVTQPTPVASLQYCNSHPGAVGCTGVPAAAPQQVATSANPASSPKKNGSQGTVLTLPMPAPVLQLSYNEWDAPFDRSSPDFPYSNVVLSASANPGPVSVDFSACSGIIKTPGGETVVTATVLPVRIYFTQVGLGECDVVMSSSSARAVRLMINVYDMTLPSEQGS